jgi:putative membrane protein
MVRNQLNIIKQGIVGRVPISNTDSAARDHLANERTLLAWIRTSISVAALTILIVRLQAFDEDKRLRTLNLILGCILMATALLMTFTGFYRYCKIHVFLLRQQYPASGLGMFITVIMTTIIIIVTLIMLLII